MGEATNQIEQNISHARSELRRNIDELERKASATFNWRTQFEAKPLPILGLAFGGGMLLSRLLSGGSRQCKKMKR